MERNLRSSPLRLMAFRSRFLAAQGFSSQTEPTHSHGTVTLSAVLDAERENSILGGASTPRLPDRVVGSLRIDSGTISLRHSIMSGTGHHG
jgi:hypothetical protein